MSKTSFVMVILLIFTAFPFLGKVAFGISSSPSHKISPHTKTVLLSIGKEVGWTEEEIFTNYSQNHDSQAEEKPAQEESLSKGEKFVLEQKRRNREKIKQLHSKNKQIKQEHRESQSIKEKYLKNLNNLKKLHQSTLRKWKKTHQQTLNRWKRKVSVFNKNLPHYKKATFDIQKVSKNELDQKPLKNIPPPKLSSPKPNSALWHILPNSLDIPVRDQGKRPTCSAFAGVRALEALLYKKGPKVDLSEQYFYFISKPKCQKSPCTKRGSWVAEGFNHSKMANEPNIPLEKNCPYNGSLKPGNETQIPLKFGCHSGKVQVQSYYKIANLEQVHQALDNNNPVILGVKLSPNFYKNNGLVTQKNAKNSGQIDEHAKGHAITVIGYMKLPKKVADKEGKHCYLVANSWGEGWGKGGHSCLTTSWLTNHLIPNALMAVKDIKLKKL